MICAIRRQTDLGFRMLSRLLTLVITLLVMFGLSELGVRLFTEQGVEQALYRPDSLYSRRFNPNMTARSRSPAGEFSTIVRTNSRGFRDRERRFEKPDGTQRVLVIGDSFAAGIEVPFDALFSQVLERRLTENGYNCEVITTAAGHYSPTNHYVVFRDLGRRYDPDVVVMTFCFNDVSEDVQHADYTTLDAAGMPVRVGAAPRLLREAESSGQAGGSALKRLVRQSALYRLVQDRFRMYTSRKLARKISERVFDRAGTGDLALDYFAVFADTLSAAQRACWERTFRIVNGLHRMAQDSGARFLIAIVPTGNQLNAEEWRLGKKFWKFQEDEMLESTEFQDRVKARAAELGIPVLDLLPALRAASAPNHRMYHVVDGHWSIDGHRVVGGRLFDYIDENGWLERE